MSFRRRSVFFRSLLVILLGAACGAWPAPAQNQSALARSGGEFQALHLKVGLVSLSGETQPGGSTQAGLHFVLDKGWHVYWINAGDSGEPPSIRWTLPAGITAGAMQFPAPQRLPLGPLMDYGYENEVLFPFELHVSRNAKAPSTVTLPAHVTWLVCREVCIPGKADLVLPLGITHQPRLPDAASQAFFAAWRARLPAPLPARAQAVFAPTASGFGIAILGVRAAPAEFFPLDPSQIDNPAPQIVRSTENGVEIFLKKDDNLRATPAELNGVLRLGDAAYTIRALRGTLPPSTSAADSVAPAASSRGMGGLLRICGLAFLGGMILNLMPCVFPVLFIKGLALVKSSGETRGRLRAHGFAYTLGILASFWVVVAILLALRAGGHRLGWGFQFQSPGFVAFVALLLFFLGLSLAGVFDIGLTLTGTGSSLAEQSGYAGSFFTGVLATVVATPCTAPFMGVAIGFALSQSAPIAFAIFTALALGLAAPYLLLTMNPAWTRLLPRPGQWMEILKQVTAGPVFATVIWLVWVFVQSSGIAVLPALLGGFLLLGIAGWILGHWPARRAAFLCALFVIALAIALPFYALRVVPAAGAGRARNDGNAAPGKDVWQPFSAAAVERYRAQNRSVFLDFTASWCLSCQVNERVVLDRPEVRERLRDSGVVLMRADWTHHDEEIAQALTRLGRSGVPTYVLYSPGAPPQVLPEVLTTGILLDAIDRLHAPLRTGEKPNTKS